MALSIEQVQAVHEKVDALIATANNAFYMYSEKPMPKPEVHFTLRGRTAGKAWGSYKINLNRVLLEENFDEMLNDTVPHEIAHCAVNYFFGTQVSISRTGRARRDSHGETWKKVMRTFGVEPNRTHSMDVTNAKQKSRQQSKFMYRCTGCGAEVPVGPKHHAKIQRGASMYHKGCKGHKLVLVEELGRVTWSEAARGMKEPERPPAPKKAPAKAKAKGLRKGTKIHHAYVIARAMYASDDVSHHAREAVLDAIENSMSTTAERARAYFNDLKKRGLI